MQHFRAHSGARIGTYRAGLFLQLNSPVQGKIGGVGDASDQGMSGRAVRSLNGRGRAAWDAASTIRRTRKFSFGSQDLRNPPKTFLRLT
jgi:hypothetical protein